MKCQHCEQNSLEYRTKRDLETGMLFNELWCDTCNRKSMPFKAAGEVTRTPIIYDIEEEKDFEEQIRTAP